MINRSGRQGAASWLTTTCSTTKIQVTGALNVRGQTKAAGRYDTQAEAHDAARGFAGRSGGGEVRDHRKDNNQIRNTDTVGKKDPYPPNG